MFHALLLAGVPLAQAAQAPPVGGDNGAVGGIFGMSNTRNLNMLGKTGKGYSPTSPELPGKGTSLLSSLLPKLAGKGSGEAGIGGLLGALGKSGDMALDKALGGAFGSKGPEAVTGGTLTDEQWADPGTGPYPAKYFTDPSLPQKTIYAPINPPKDNIKMPVIVWGEGGCYKTGTFYQPYLTEIASHGYLVLANGPPVGGPPKTLADFARLMTLGQNKISDLQNSIDWALKGNGAKYGNIDTTRIAAGGQSCGGTEALSVSYHNDLVKLTFLVNSGALNPKSRVWLKELKYPVAYFNGGPKDIAYKNGVEDYEVYPPTVPVVLANLDTGHGGTLFGLNGGKFGKATVAFLEWNFRGDPKSKAIILDPKSPGSLVSQNWNVSAKNWN